MWALEIIAAHTNKTIYCSYLYSLFTPTPQKEKEPQNCMVLGNLGAIAHLFDPRKRWTISHLNVPWQTVRETSFVQGIERLRWSPIRRWGSIGPIGPRGLNYIHTKVTLPFNVQGAQCTTYACTQFLHVLTKSYNHDVYFYMFEKLFLSSTLSYVKVKINKRKQIHTCGMMINHFIQGHPCRAFESYILIHMNENNQFKNYICWMS